MRNPTSVSLMFLPIWLTFLYVSPHHCCCPSLRGNLCHPGWAATIAHIGSSWPHPCLTSTLLSPLTHMLSPPQLWLPTLGCPACSLAGMPLTPCASGHCPHSACTPGSHFGPWWLPNPPQHRHLFFLADCSLRKERECKRREWRSYSKDSRPLNNISLCCFILMLMRCCRNS